MRLVLTSISLLLNIVAYVSAKERCQLGCEHGKCFFVSDEPAQLAILVQSGKMIEQCECEDGYGGVACDIEHHSCQSDGKCTNGVPCHYVQGTGEYSCDCAEADRVSKFAGMMCRNPYTEYCADKYDPNEETSFCTNGGKCKSSFIGAQVAPGNTTVNNEYRHLGCVCPKEFYGSHCEFLKLDPVALSDTNTSTSTLDESQEVNKEDNLSEIPDPTMTESEQTNGRGGIPMIASLCSVAFFIALLGLFGRRRRMSKREIFSDELNLHGADACYAYPPQHTDLTYEHEYCYPQQQWRSQETSFKGEPTSLRIQVEKILLTHCFTNHVTSFEIY